MPEVDEQQVPRSGFLVRGRRVEACGTRAGQRSAAMDGVLLVAHGSLRAGSDTTLHAVVAELNAVWQAGPTVPPKVLGCFLNYGEPLLEAGFAQLAAMGATTVRVQPYFLFGGQYTGRDLPQRLRELDRRWPAVGSVLGPEIAEHPAWTRAVMALAMPAIDPSDPELGCLFVVHGSRFEPAVEQVRRMTGRLREVLSPVPVATGYLDVEQPDVLTAASNLYDEGIRRLCVVPVLLSAGRHTREDVPGAIESFQHRHPDCTVVLTDHLGETTFLTPILQDLVTGRIVENFGLASVAAEATGMLA